MPIYEFECPCGLVADILVSSHKVQTTTCEECGEKATRTGRPLRVNGVVKDSTPHADNVTYSEAELDRRVGEDAERKWAGEAPRLPGQAVVPAGEAGGSESAPSPSDLEYRKQIEGIMKREVARKPSVQSRKDGPRIYVGRTVPEGGESAESGDS